MSGIPISGRTDVSAGLIPVVSVPEIFGYWLQGGRIDSGGTSGTIQGSAK